MATFPDELRGERLRLCRWSLDAIDEVTVAVHNSFDELHTWMAWAEDLPTRESLVALTRENIVRFDADERWSYFIRELDGGQLVGSAGLVCRGIVNELEIGYWVRTDRTRHGYATEAAGLLTDAAFKSDLDIAVVNISMDKSNHASAAVPPKLGFVLDVEYERDVVAPGQSGRAIVWVIRRADWQTRSSSSGASED
jgi:RimJ/RimL family protein N-acetyltransferase